MNDIWLQGVCLQRSVVAVKAAVRAVIAREMSGVSMLPVFAVKRRAFQGYCFIAVIVVMGLCCGMWDAGEARGQGVVEAELQDSRPLHGDSALSTEFSLTENPVAEVVSEVFVLKDAEYGEEEDMERAFEVVSSRGLQLWPQELWEGRGDDLWLSLGPLGVVGGGAYGALWSRLPGKMVLPAVAVAFIVATASVLLRAWYGGGDHAWEAGWLTESGLEYDLQEGQEMVVLSGEGRLSPEPLTAMGQLSFEDNKGQLGPSNGGHPSAITLFVEGQCRPHPGEGVWGVLIQYKEHELAYTGKYADSTNERMELVAAVKGLTRLHTTKRPVVLYTHSKSIADAVNLGWMRQWQSQEWKTVANAELWRAFDLQRQRFKHLRVLWVEQEMGKDRVKKLIELAWEEEGKVKTDISYKHLRKCGSSRYAPAPVRPPMRRVRRRR